MPREPNCYVDHSHDQKTGIMAPNTTGPGADHRGFEMVHGRTFGVLTVAVRCLRWVTCFVFGRCTRDAFPSPIEAEQQISLNHRLEPSDFRVAQDLRPISLKFNFDRHHQSLTSHRPFANINVGCLPTSCQQDFEGALESAPHGRMMDNGQV
jgi:hypothetical protein